MPGKPKDDPNKTQQEGIAAKKPQCIEVYAALGVKKAAAAVGCSLARINQWEAEDEQLRLGMSRAEYRFLDKHKYKGKLDNVFAHLFEEYAPPTQKVDAKVTTVEGQSAADLLAEAKRLGLDTTPHESLLTGNSTPGTADQDPSQDGATSTRSANMIHSTRLTLSMSRKRSGPLASTSSSGLSTLLCHPDGAQRRGTPRRRSAGLSCAGHESEWRSPRMQHGERRVTDH